MERYACIHAHFYQPPRENPWLEAVELQDSAYPFHDWNERIAAECYAPNGAARILDGAGRIARITNNYAQISFNFGPTLLSWLSEFDQETYQAILEADRQSRERFSGHGSALAQAYNHMILPLANRRDQRTQILWGLRDFERRFGRKAEGMWLPETAASTETLDILAELGVRFTVLAPHQARRVRPLGASDWQDVSGGRVDPTRAYEARLPSGRRMALFFYDGPISRAVAFEGLLSNGERFAARLLGGFSGEGDCPQLVHIATDGESYGHHHRHGDMALAFALRHLESLPDVRLTNYGEYLERHPTTHEAEIFDNSSWSCAHGIERWKSDCGCNSGGRPGWNQGWRAPLREALDWLRDSLASPYEERARELLADPWAARDDYIQVILDRSEKNLERFFASRRPPGAHVLDAEAQVRACKLLEMQRHLMLMYTSCGWFFDELSGIETVQVIQYAGRAIQLAGELFGRPFEEEFLERLARARSNLPEQGDGAAIYRRAVKPAMVDLPKVMAHYAISSLFEAYPERQRIYCYTVDREEHRLLEAGKTRLAVGRARVVSKITREEAHLSYGVLHFGDHNLNAGVRLFRGETAFQELMREGSEAFGRADLPAVIRLMDRHFEGTSYSLKTLFRDEQRKIIEVILGATLRDTEAAYRQVYEHNAPLMRFLAELGMPMPKVFFVTAEFALNQGLRRALENGELDFDRIRALLEAARVERVSLDAAGLAFAFQHTLERKMEEFIRAPGELPLLQELVAAAELVREMPFEVNLWRVQNVYFELHRQVAPEFRALDTEPARDWAELFDALGGHLAVRPE